MKLLSIVTAGLVAAASLAPIAIATPASAQHRTVVVHRTVVTHSRPAYHPTYRHRARQVCTNVWRHHRRVHSCRTVYR